MFGILSINSRSIGTLRRVVFQSVFRRHQGLFRSAIALPSEMIQAAGPQTDEKLGYSWKLGEIFITKKSVDAAVSENALKHQAAMKIMAVPRVFVDWDVWRLVFQFQIFDLQERHTFLEKYWLGFWTTFLNKKYLWVLVQAAAQTVCHLVASMQFQTKAATLVVYSFKKIS